MLDKLDDFPIHQTSRPLAYPATSDRNFYDRTWFNGYAPDGSFYFGLGMAVYPHREILDCAFSVVERDGRQHCFFGSRRAPRQRTEMAVGPLRLEVVEPLRQARVTLASNDSGIECDLLFSARTAALEEGRQTLMSGTRPVMDATRFAQFGRWRGRVRHPDGELEVSPSSCVGTKDRSWGVRGVGEPETGGAPRARGFFFLWAPLVWSDHVSHAIFFDDQRGGALHREGLLAPLAHELGAVVDDEGQVVRMAEVDHRIDYLTGTRWARSAEIGMIAADGGRRVIRLEPLLRFHMKGLGYQHPEWGQGFWKGELATGADCFAPGELDPLARENVHVQQVVKASDGESEGVGVLEHLCLGPYAPAGLTQFLDGAQGGSRRDGG